MVITLSVWFPAFRATTRLKRESEMLVLIVAGATFFNKADTSK